MIYRCPSLDCTSRSNRDPKKRSVVRNGSYFRKSDSRKIRLFLCKTCGKRFSSQTGKPDAYLKVRRITHPLFQLLSSGVTQRRAAILLGVNKKTIVRRFRFISRMKAIAHQEWLDQEYAGRPLNYVQFDDVETAEHTKCKPLSVALAVDPQTRKILSFQVNQMPAKGPLAKTARKKYGYRQDQRYAGWDALLRSIKPYITKDAVIHSDENPHYGKFVRKHYPHAFHLTAKGGRGSISGQGELKKLRFDPLFSLNHTCAMLRANLNRLFRRTWSITKNRQGLVDHMNLYVQFHNTVLTKAN